MPEEVPRRIVSLSPSVTETLFAVGAGDNVVGTSSWCNRPEEAIRRPKVGSYTEINWKKLKELKPDLIISTSGAQMKVFEELKRKGYKVYVADLPTSVYDVFDLFYRVGGIVGRYKETMELVYKAEEKLGRAVKAVKYSKMRAYVELDLGGPCTPGYFSYITSTLMKVNLVNIFWKERAGYLFGNNLPKDAMAKWFDVFIYESKEGEPDPLEARKLAESRGWKVRYAVTLPNDTLAHHGPSFFDGLLSLVRKLNDLL